MADPTQWVAGKYELVAPIGEGGMATVWLGLTHGAAGFTRKVAVKRILPKLAVDSAFAALFVEEARVVSELQHPNIVQIHDFDRDADGRHFIVMEWVDGIDLDSYIRSFSVPDEPTPWPMIAAIGIEVLRALAAAHERVDDAGLAAPVIHRDVNPANILLGANGVVKLADFGLSRAMDRVSMTAPGVVKGKLGYLSPEILGGKPATERSDVFGVGITLWEALTKKRLFGGHPDVIMRVREARVPPLRDERADLPPALGEIVHGALAARPEDRFESAEEMQRALASVLRGFPEPTDARPLGRSVREARARLASLQKSGA